MSKLSLTLLTAALFAWNADPVHAGNQPPPDYRFQIEVLAEGMRQPMELEVAPDGRIFFNEIEGNLQFYNPSSGQVHLAGSIPVFTDQENGFLGFALDPGFQTNQWIYLLYSPTNYTGQRLSRFVMRAEALDRASEKIVLEFGEQRRECCHHAGSVEFGPDGNLYISTGDNTHPHGDSSGYAPIDERPGREPYDAQKSSANTDDLRGKILRIRPTPEGGYTIPEGNLFPKDGSQGRPEIFVMGCRNPWRMSIDQRTGFVYWGDVGPDAGGDGPRGPRGYDEINQARSAGNFGWPYFIGNNFAYADYDFAAKQVGALFDAAFPTNQSPSNTGAKVLPPAQPALIYWPYGTSSEFPMLGSGGRTACAGPVFYFDPKFRETGGFPEYYDGCLLFYDWQRPFMRWARLDEKSGLAGIEPFTEAVVLANDHDRVKSALESGAFVLQRPVDSQFGADGCLYLLDYGETWRVNKDSRLIKISYQWGNVAPIARISADQKSGPEPLTVQFSSAGSQDYEGDSLQFQWLLHPGDHLLSEEPNPVLTVTNAGNHVVELRVSDGKGGMASANLPLIVGNTPPEIRFIRPSHGDFFTPGTIVDFELSVVDAEDGASEDFDEFFDPRTFVRATALRDGRAASQVEPGLALMRQSDCFNCHAIDQKIVGPAFLEIAERYRDQSEALELSVARVLNGSSGVWSEVPMLPHPSLNSEKIRQMVEWIYKLEPGKSSDNIVRGLAGTITAPNDPNMSSLLLEASYTDAGKAPASSLAGNATVELRSRRLEAEFADEKSGPKVLGSFLGAIDHEHFARFASIPVGDCSGVTVRVASAGQGGKIELRAKTLDGPLLAAFDVPITGGWDKWIELSSPVHSELDRCDLFVRFLNPGKGGLMNLDWIQFNPSSESAQ